MSKHVVSIGDLVLDLITPVRLPIQPFKHQEIRILDFQPGGGCNFMIMARRLGLRVSAIGTLGTDAFGNQLRTMLKAENIDLRGVVSMPGSRTTVVYDLIDTERHEHAFIAYNATGPVARYDNIMDAVLISGHAVFMQAYNLMEQQLAEIVDPVMERARQKRIPIFFDVGPTVAHVKPKMLEQAMARADYLMMTEEEMSLAACGKTGAAAIDYLLGLGPHTLVIKQQERGCTVVQRDWQQHFDAFRVNVIDSVGAGDCFNAAFIYGFLHGYDLSTCAILGNAAGGASVQKLGSGLNVPTCAEVQAVLASTSLEVSLPC
ncbi:MAG: carbohydrate kinase family protein [Anaerolineae bacterium]|nr:carbohydrate kinase family protein [Anaerolineae bacterium]MDW8172769.1 carbohydrate kinase family protein [Anaerolineae bacterium]